MTENYYRFDPKSNRYLGLHIPQQDSQGNLLLPPNVTTVSPGTDPFNKRWTGTTWVTVDLEDTVQAKYIRGTRDLLLQQSDWTQLADVNVNKQAWANYRQALRDIPQQSDYPNNVTWPIMPSN